MSGVYISGMEMLKYIEPGLVIEFADGIDGKRYARLHHYIHGGLTEWLEAIPVPDHGRLIDADALVDKHFDKDYLEKAMTASKDEMGTALVNIPLVINNAPTIIPASGKEEQT